MDDNNKVIDIVGYLQLLWRHWPVFLVSFIVVMLAGTGWVLTRPAQYDVTQTVVISLPSVEQEAQATQQSASLAGTVATYVKMASLPATMQPVLDKHPDVESLEALRGLVSITPVTPMAVDLKATGQDAEALKSLVADLAQSWVAVAPEQLGDVPQHLRFSLATVDEPVITAAPGGRLIRLAAVGVVSLLVATVATAVAVSMKGRGSKA